MSPAGLGTRFWTLFSAFTASNLGDGLTLVGFPLMAVALTDDARLIAGVAALRVLPFLVVGLPAGVFIDRFDRRHIAMGAQTIRAATMFVLAGTVWSETVSIATLGAAAFVVGTGEVLTDGGLPAVVRDVVQTSQLEVANSRLRAIETVANNFVGPPVGALLFGADSALPFAGAGIAYTVSVALLGGLKGSFVPQADPDAGSFRQKIARGLTYVWRHPVLRPLALSVAAFACVGEATNAVFVILMTERLGFTELQYGLILTFDAVASVTMSFFVAGLVRRTSHGMSMRVSVVFYAIGSLLLGFATFTPLIIVAVLCGGISDPTWNVISGTVRQRLVDDFIFGRMMTAYLFIAWSIKPVGALLGGVIAEAVGSQWVFVLAGVVVGSLLVLAQPMFERINAAMQASAPAPVA